jgi:hypothetical protein
VACGIFAAHGRDALDAFGGMWGSTRDSYGRQMKNYCVHKILTGAAPAKVDAIMKAQGELFDALLEVARMPDGTMFHAMYVGATNVVRDALLAPEVPLEPMNRSLDEEVKSASKTDPAIRGRLGAYRAVEARSVPVIAEGLCAVLAARGRAADPAACKALAKDASTRALAQWIGSAHIHDD